MTIDYGQADIAAFKQGALSGHIKFDPQAVDDVVRVYDVLIEGLRKEISKIQNIAVMTSFGGFPSTQQLAAGFARKADELNVVLKQFIIGAMQLQEAYLIAAGKTTEAEAKNTQVLQAIGRDLDAERPGV
ncbi:hypothetical protein [Nocardia terpenica]|uniref:Uncharacterized protein n=1 Tax=Nocardia terpenica TaxID=455432 RepID=A0A6G9Z0K2_9NOCA|nr:hypothetical protein [Nocardia terpenica]QIS18901.1 hypothetical protein F6W96_11955 [Nocardia terpenica]